MHKLLSSRQLQASHRSQLQGTSLPRHTMRIITHFDLLIITLTFVTTQQLYDNSTCRQENKCFNKCCQSNFALNFTNHSDRPSCLSMNTTSEMEEELSKYESVVFGLPDCSGGYDISVEPQVLPSIHCIDDLITSNSSDFVKLICIENKTVSPPKGPIYRKCCLGDRIYDMKAHTCVVSNITDDFDIFDYLPENTTENQLIYGMPNCSKVLVDISFNNLIDVSSTVFIEELKDTDNMCVDQIAQTGLFGGRRCEERKKTCGNIPCVSKCCPPGQHYYISPKSCVSSERPFNPPIYNTSKAKSVLVSEPPEYGIIHGMKCRRYLMKYHETELDMNYLSLNGSLFVPNFNSYFSVDEYCLEDFYMPSRKMDGLFALICFRTVDSVQPTSFDIKYILIATGLIISCVFLLATLVVYLCLPTLQNLHGMTLMSHVSSFLVACVCLAAIQIGSPSFGSNNRACQTLGVVMLFGFLAAFAWMNMMCFDIWWTFGGMRSVNHGSSKRRERRRFAWYSLYAWGLPCVIIALLLTAEFVDGVPASIKPMFGMDTCWFPSENVQRDNYSKLMFFIAPVALLITCNVVLFVMTAVACNRVKAEISRMQKSSDDGRKKKFQADKNKLMMNGKLFIIMGVNWMIEVIGLLVPKMPTFWVYIPDTFNALQGVFIFAIFVMKPKVLKALADRLGLKRNRKETLIQAANNKLLIANDPRRKISTSTSTCFTTTTSANDNDRVDRV